VVYRWEQSLEDVTVRARLPPGAAAAHVACALGGGGNNVRLGLRGAGAPYLDARTAGPIVADESTWFVADADDDDTDDGAAGAAGGATAAAATAPRARQVTIVLVKARPGEAWPSAFAGHAPLDAEAHEADRKAILLERFGAEHPGFDFRDAAVSGEVPDAREFMGGMRRA
jgi:hypothetical protein